MVILSPSKLEWQQDQRSNLTPHFQCRENYLGNEIWYLSAPSSPRDIQIWLLACIWSFQFTSQSQVNSKSLLKTPGMQLTGCWAQLSLSCTAGPLPSWHQSFSRQGLGFFLSVQKHNPQKCVFPVLWGKTWVLRSLTTFPVCSGVRHGWPGVKVQLFRHYYVIKNAVPDALKSSGVLKTLGGCSDKQYIAKTDCIAGSSLLLEWQPCTVLGMPKIFPSSWDLGMGQTRHLSGYSQGLSSSSQFSDCSFLLQQPQGVWFLVWQVLFGCAENSG